MRVYNTLLSSSCCVSARFRKPNCFSKTKNKKRKKKQQKTSWVKHREKKRNQKIYIIILLYSTRVSGRYWKPSAHALRLVLVGSRRVNGGSRPVSRRNRKCPDKHTPRERTIGRSWSVESVTAMGTYRVAWIMLTVDKSRRDHWVFVAGEQRGIPESALRANRDLRNPGPTSSLFRQKDYPPFPQPNTRAYMFPSKTGVEFLKRQFLFNFLTWIVNYFYFLNLLTGSVKFCKVLLSSQNNTLIYSSRLKHECVSVLAKKIGPVRSAHLPVWFSVQRDNVRPMLRLGSVRSRLFLWFGSTIRSTTGWDDAAPPSHNAPYEWQRRRWALRGGPARERNSDEKTDPGRRPPPPTIPRGSSPADRFRSTGARARARIRLQQCAGNA